MANAILPEGKPIPMDRLNLCRLIRDALIAIRRDSASVNVETSEMMLFRPTEDGDTFRRVPVPAYRKALWAQRDAVAKGPEIAALVEHLWSHNAWKLSMSSGTGELAKEGWAANAWPEILLLPFQYVLFLTMTERLVRDGVCDRWEIAEQHLGAAVDDIADRLMVKNRRAEAVVPLVGIQWFLTDEPTEIEPGVTLEPWAAESRCIFLTRYHTEYLDDDFASNGGAGFLRMTVSVDPKATDLASSVASTIDRIKWALAVANKSRPGVFEGPAIIRFPAGDKKRTLRRGDIPTGESRSYSLLHFDKENIPAAQSLLIALAAARKVAPNLDDVLIAFGRSCSATLPRDVLLEAAIGLEMLLVPGGGEIKYKFSLHGGAVLAHLFPGADLFKELSEIYNLRSNAAHGNRSSNNEFQASAPRARELLAYAIYGVLDLASKGELGLDAAEGNLGHSVKTLVLARSLRPVVPTPPA